MPQPERPTPLALARPHLLRGYRLAVIVAAVLLMRYHHQRVLVQGDRPITLDEVRHLLPGAAALETDLSDRRGLIVRNDAGDDLGYALRTSPISDDIVGYSGPTDTLVVFDHAGKIVGVRIRYSADTISHVKDVVDDEYHMSRWDGMTWEQAATMDLDEAGVEGVSGATYTSMAMAHGIVQRLAWSHDRVGAPPMPVRWDATDLGLVAVLLVAVLMTFTHLRGRRWVRRLYQAALIGYVGLVTGDLLAQSLFAGWASAGVNWRMAPALALLAGAALVVPWATRRPIYCAQLCPHGAAQELIGRLTTRRLRVPRKLDRGLRCAPPLLVVLVIVVTMLGLPFDLAGIEPFDAYLIASAGVATIAVAVVGLVAAAFIPMAYCKYGCPTGCVLEFVRSHGSADRFSRRDVVAGLIVTLIATISWQHDAIRAALITGGHG